MGRKADGQVKESEDGRTRTEVIVERFDFEAGIWKQVEIENAEQYLNDDPELQDAIIDIVATISDIFITGKNTNILD